MIPTNSPIKSNGNSKLTAELFEAGGVAVGEAKSAISAEPTAGQIEFGVNTRSKSLFENAVAARALPSVDAVRALRAALKTLLRRYGLRCLSIEVEPANLEEAEDG